MVFSESGANTIKNRPLGEYLSTANQRVNLLTLYILSIPMNCMIETTIVLTVVLLFYIIKSLNFCLIIRFYEK